ncbi:MAG: ABC transporter permease [Bacillota bacterium]|nr:ABC transporter permease [Bacillota bacterium]
MSSAKKRNSKTVWARFRRHRLALMGGGIMAMLVFLAVFAPWVSPRDPYAVDLAAYRSPPSAQYWLGADSSGRDVLSRLIYGARISLSVGIVAVGIYTVIGVLLGVFSGYYGGWVDHVVMRLADVVLSFPVLLLLITMVAIVGPSLANVMLVIGLVGWPPLARLVRGEFLSLRTREFVEAALASGARDARIIFVHMLPNVVPTIMVNVTLGVAQAVLIESAMSFLGVGVPPPIPSWGNMLTDAQSLTILRHMPWLWVPPGLMIALSVLSINFVGDGLRDALDVRADDRGG